MHSLTVLTGAWLLQLPALAVAAPQTTNTALPVGEGNFVYRQQFFHARASVDTDQQERDIEVSGEMSVLGYVLTPDWAVFAALPYFWDRKLSLDGPDEARVSRSTRGLGDARVFARYTLHRDDAPGRTFRIAPFAGVEAPTGRDDDRDVLVHCIMNGDITEPLNAHSRRCIGLT